MKRFTVFLILSAMCSPGTAAPQPLSYLDLVQRLTNLEHLATLPAPGERTAQWSSYDRASRYDEAAGKYVAWDANGDGGGIIRKEGDKLVFAEMEGPGCIWRIWSADPKEGHVRIYLDGAAEPAVDLPFMGYFDGKNAPFTRTALVYTVARGWNNYTPIPYQKSCKIVADANWGRYFHFNYTTYPKGTQVPTFKRNLTPQENAALDDANRQLSSCGPAQRDRQATRTFDGILPANGATAPLKLNGPGAIACIRAKLELPPSPADRQALREVTLEIRWDGEPKPSVWAPLGDFFGTIAVNSPYRSLPCGLTDDGWWYANWFMPFARSAEITVRNEGKQDRKLKLEVLTIPLKTDAAKLARFHAKWHRDTFLPSDPARRIDWTMLQTEGRGRFVGVMLHVWNPRGKWWGEGDEKLFVDGEKFPSTIGTGSEDYFGYAWCNPSLFQGAYHNQPLNDGGNRGHIIVNRWHVGDQVPFQQSFEGCIEKYFPNSRPTLYAATSYWYLAPGSKDPYQPVPLSERTGYWSDIPIFKIGGAIEGENLKILAKTAGKPREQDLTQFSDQWSNEAHLWWTDAKPGDRLDLALPVSKSGKFQLIVQLTKARDYGIVQLSLDDRPLGGPIDLYNANVVPTGELNLGAHELTAGQHKLSVQITGANPQALPRHMFGLDYVKLGPAN